MKWMIAWLLSAAVCLGQVEAAGGGKKPHEQKKLELDQLKQAKKEGKLPKDWKAKAHQAAMAIASDTNAPRALKRKATDIEASLDPVFDEAIGIIEAKAGPELAAMYRPGARKSTVTKDSFNWSERGYYSQWREKVENLCREQRFTEAKAVAQAWSLKSGPVMTAFPTATTTKLDYDDSGHTREDRDWIYKNIVLAMSAIRKAEKAGTITAQVSATRKIAVMDAAIANLNKPEWYPDATATRERMRLSAVAGNKPTEAELEAMISAATNTTGLTVAQKNTRIAQAKAAAAKINSAYKPIETQLSDIAKEGLSVQATARKQAAALEVAAALPSTIERNALVYKARAVVLKYQAGDLALHDAEAAMKPLVEREAVREPGNPHSQAVIKSIAGQLDPRWVAVVDVLTKGVEEPKPNSYMAMLKGKALDLLQAGEYDLALQVANQFRAGMKK